MNYKNKERSIVVTGSSGFIGYHLANALLDKGIPVIGIDNLNPYYDIELKKAREKNLYEKSNKNKVPFDFFR